MQPHNGRGGGENAMRGECSGDWLIRYRAPTTTEEPAQTHEQRYVSTDFSNDCRCLSGA